MWWQTGRPLKIGLAHVDMCVSSPSDACDNSARNQSVQRSARYLEAP
jgi:hypothetical protein